MAVRDRNSGVAIVFVMMAQWAAYPDTEVVDSEVCTSSSFDNGNFYST